MIQLMMILYAMTNNNNIKNLGVQYYVYDDDNNNYIWHSVIQEYDNIQEKKNIEIDIKQF